MPYIHIRVGTELSDAQRDRLFDGTTELMSSILGKNRAVTVVQVEEQRPSRWSVGGQALTQGGGTAAYVDIKVTEGTNTPDEKSAMIAATVALLRETIGPLQEATYVVIHDIDPQSWGYDGKTQAARTRTDL